jgi:hypothetical protein
MRAILLSFAAAALLASSASAAPCKDAHGKFMKCKPMVMKPVRCKDMHGKFMKCGMPGARPM